MPQQTVCPSCAEPLDPEDAFCGACGAGRNGPPTMVDGPPTAVGGPAGPATGACAHCGAAELTADGYCEACGRAQPAPRDHQERSLTGVAGVTDRGLRHHRNEDAFTIAATSLPGGEPAVIAVVCDGVSSSARPDEASATAVDAASESLLTALERGTDPTAAMHGAITVAGQAVTDLAYDGKTPQTAGHINAPACTYVSAIAAGGLVTIGWVGDTRAYWIPDDRESAEPYRLTEDDSWAARMVAAGLMKEAEAYADPRAHAITGWLGADAEELLPHTVSFTPHVPGVVLICTDGLWNYAEAATDLAFFVRADARTEPLAAARSLVDFAVTAGGHDNITVAVLPITPPAAGGGASAAAGAARTAEPAAYEATLIDLPLPAPRHDDTLPDLPVHAPGTALTD
ncbi:PP2C family serine/threonine-protein phosphatase [Kitasatospora paracochleata]|uniref:PP2C family serine/threonine-protein phosphatase n=1 Tax=Kitasatospora paracochleata TaxID=58354 RepID=UPI0031D4122C